MILLVSFIHSVFVAIFFLFHRYVETGIILGVWLLFLSKIIPHFDVFVKKPKFLKKKVLEGDVLEQSLYLSSGVLFYTALIGVALGGANILGLPIDRELINYCAFFLTSILFGIYLLTYPKNPNSSLLFRIHCIIAGTVINTLVLMQFFGGTGAVTISTIINILLLIFGIAIGLIFDRNISLSTNIFSVYFLILLITCFVIGGSSFFSLSAPFLVLLLLWTFAFLYFLFPPILAKSCKIQQIPFLSWHFRNSILAISWMIFIFAFWSLFWGNPEEVLSISSILIVLLGFWLYVYSSEKDHPLFFAGIIAVLGVLVLFLIFRVFPQIFWITVSLLFAFAGGLLLLSYFFKNRQEELILALGSVIFLCVSDVSLIFQDNNLFALALLFLFQSLIWYGAYEIFHRQSNVKKRAL